MKEQALKPYLFEYKHDGATWGLKIDAESPQDAQARLKSLAWSQYKGEIMLTVSLPRTGLHSIWKSVRSCFR